MPSLMQRNDARLPRWQLFLALRRLVTMVAPFKARGYTKVAWPRGRLGLAAHVFWEELRARIWSA